MIIAEGVMKCGNEIRIIHPYGSVKYGESLCRSNVKTIQLRGYTLVWDEDGDIYTPLSFVRTFMKDNIFSNGAIVKSALLKDKDYDDNLGYVLDRIDKKVNMYLEDVRLLRAQETSLEDRERVARMMNKCFSIDDCIVKFAFFLGLWFKKTKGYDNYVDRALAGARYLWCTPGHFSKVLNPSYRIEIDHCINRSFFNKRHLIWSKIKFFVSKLK